MRTFKVYIFNPALLQPENLYLLNCISDLVHLPLFLRTQWSQANVRLNNETGCKQTVSLARLLKLKLQLNAPEMFGHISLYTQEQDEQLQKSTSRWR